MGATLTWRTRLARAAAAAASAMGLVHCSCRRRSIVIIIIIIIIIISSSSSSCGPRRGKEGSVFGGALSERRGWGASLPGSGGGGFEAGRGVPRRTPCGV